MQSEITEFICAQRIATICYVNNGIPYCFNCMYAYIPELEKLIFKSSKSSEHALVLQNEDRIAGTIYQASQNGFNNTGLQLLARIETENKNNKNAEITYYHRFPAARLMPGQLFILSLDEVKFSRAIYGTKKKVYGKKDV